MAIKKQKVTVSLPLLNNAQAINFVRDAIKAHASTVGLLPGSVTVQHFGSGRSVDALNKIRKAVLQRDSLSKADILRLLDKHLTSYKSLEEKN